MKRNTINKKRIISLTLAAIIAACSLTACTSTSTDEGAKNNSTAEGSSTAQKETDPEKKGTGKLKIALPESNMVTSYESKDNYFTKYMEERTGAELEMYLLPSAKADMLTKISLMINSQSEMPDVLITTSLNDTTIIDYGSKGVFIPLNDYVNDKEKSPYFSAIEGKDKETMMTGITSPDGNIYSLPTYTPEAWNFSPDRMYINEAWLNKLNMKMPTTIDEFYDVLVAFRDKDPNGNGKQDEIPVYGMIGGYGETLMALMNSFVFYTGNQIALNEAGDKVIAPFTSDDYKDGLKFMNKLCNEKLLSPAIFTDDGTQFKATLNNPDANIVGFVAAGSVGNWPDVAKNPYFQEMSMMAPMKGPKGYAYTNHVESTPYQSFFITSACKDPELAYKLGDVFFDPEVTMISRFGEENVNWSRDPAVCATVSNAYVELGLADAVKYVVTDDTWIKPVAKTWHGVGPRYCPLESTNYGGNNETPFDKNSKVGMINALHYQYYTNAHPEKLLPKLTYTMDESKTIGEPIANIKEYINQSMAEFITGGRNIEKDWDNYLKELDKMGLQTWLTTAQAAFDRIK